ASVNVDHVRAMLYRIDGDAHTVRLHPQQAWGPARSAARAAEEIAGDLRKQAPPELAVALVVEARALEEAAQHEEEPSVRDHALALEGLVREIDEQLPAHEVAQ